MQLMENVPPLNSSVVTGLCVECAVRRHDFKEILAHGKGDDLFYESPLPAAWIDGRRYKLLTPVGRQKVTCRECNRKVTSIFLPIVE